MGEYAELALDSAYESYEYDEYPLYGDEEDDIPNSNTHWRQKNGVLIPIDEMDITHVRNTVRMLRRNDKVDRIPSRMLERIKEGDKAVNKRVIEFLKELL